MPTQRIDKQEQVQSIDWTIKAIDEASHFLRSQGDVYSSRQAARLEIASDRMTEVAASMRLKEDDNG